MPSSLVCFGVFFLLVAGCSSSKRGEGRTGPTPRPHPSRKQPGNNHISEFTDPDTGLNPFLDLEEGRAPDMGRNLDEGREVADPPFHPDPMEGEASRDVRRLNADSLQPTWLWQVVDDDEDPEEVATSTEVPATPSDDPTTTTSFVEEEAVEERWSVSREAVACASVTTSAVVLLVVVTAGACWWRRRRFKRTRTPVPPETGGDK